MASNLSRKALKQDKFAVEVEHTVDFFAAHRPQVIRYGGIALAVILIAGVAWFFRSSQRSARQQVLGQAMSLLRPRWEPPRRVARPASLPRRPKMTR